MSPLEKLAAFLRKIPLIGRIEEFVWNLPQPYSAILTALGHAFVTAISGPLAPVIAILYTRRELRDVRDRGYTSPEYDHVSDVVAPWAVVIVYAVLVTSWLS